MCNDKGLEPCTIVKHVGDTILVMVDIIIKGDDAYPIFRDITYSQPCYLERNDLEHLFGKTMLQFFNVWTHEQIEDSIEHMD